MLKGFLILFFGLILIMLLGLLVRWIFFTVIRTPKKIKSSIQNALDKQINRAVERNYQPTIVEEHNTYNDIKILKKNDVNISL